MTMKNMMYLSQMLLPSIFLIQGFETARVAITDPVQLDAKLAEEFTNFDWTETEWQDHDYIGTCEAVYKEEYNYDEQEDSESALNPLVEIEPTCVSHPIEYNESDPTISFEIKFNNSQRVSGESGRIQANLILCECSATRYINNEWDDRTDYREFYLAKLKPPDSYRYFILDLVNRDNAFYFNVKAYYEL